MKLLSYQEFLDEAVAKPDIYRDIIKVGKEMAQHYDLEVDEPNQEFTITGKGKTIHKSGADAKSVFDDMPDNANTLLYLLWVAHTNGWIE